MGIIPFLILQSCILESKEISCDILQVGDALPSFRVKMSNGRIISNDSLEGKVSIIVFYSTECPDCIRALPMVDRCFLELRPNREVEFLLISRGGGDTLSLWKNLGLSLPFMVEENIYTYSLFANCRVPRIYISDKGRTIRYLFSDFDLPSERQLIEYINGLD